MEVYNSILVKESVEKFFNTPLTHEDKSNSNNNTNFNKLVRFFTENKSLHDIDVRNAIIHSPSKRQEGEDFTFYKQRLKIRSILTKYRNMFFDIPEAK
jgi:hypothetical protein